MISNFKCANLANSTVKKLVGFEPGRKYHFLLRDWCVTGNAIAELTVG